MVRETVTIRVRAENVGGVRIDPKTQLVQGQTVCLVACQRSPEPVFLKWKGVEKSEAGDFYVRSGPGSIRLNPEDAAAYIRTRFPGFSGGSNS